MVPQMLSALPQSSYSITVENISLFSLSASFNPEELLCCPLPPSRQGSSMLGQQTGWIVWHQRPLRHPWSPPPLCLGLLQLPPVSRCRRCAAPASPLFSFPSPACSDVMGSSKPAMAGVFIPWKLASTPHQGLFVSFREPVYQNATGLTDLDGFVRERGRRGEGARGYQHRRTPVSLTQDIRGGGCSWHRHSGAHLVPLERNRTAKRRLGGERARHRIARAGGRKGTVV